MPEAFDPWWRIVANHKEISSVLDLPARGGMRDPCQKVIDIGPLEATTETKKTIPLSPLVGLAAVAAGVIIVVMSRKV